ncbi:MAG: ABC transporter permease subunit [Halobacteriovoraceae bacterium]|nr:ABC transporter permease subunit [Halobacteriovoraceae bacterium]
MKSDISIKRWRRFKSRKTAVVCSILLLIGVLLTFSAPLISNSKPLFLYYENRMYFPVFFDYHPETFKVDNVLVMNYRKLSLNEKDFAVWTPFKWDPFESNHAVESYPSPPSAENVLGTDDRGRDIFARLLYGFKYSISYAILVWFFSFVIGIVIGGSMGFFGGKVDFLGQRIVEMFNSIPGFFLLLTLIATFKPSLFLLVIFSVLFQWISISYYVRGEFLKYRKWEFVEAAQALGVGNKDIIFKHILPNSMAPIITFTPFTIAGNITALASLDYLGFGLEVPTPSWGELLAQGQRHFTIGWWLALFPSLALFSSLVVLNLIGEGVRDAMDPKLG